MAQSNAKPMRVHLNAGASGRRKSAPDWALALRLAVASCLAASLAGCLAVGPNYLKAAAIVPARYKEIAGWKVASPRAGEAKGAWWSIFHDPELDRLEQMVAVSNQTIKADEANYREALALINESRAAFFPTASVAPTISRNSQTGTTLDVEPAASWTLDIWGKTARSVESQDANAEAIAADLANATLATQSALALAYVQVREADSLADLLSRTIRDYQRSLDITQNQYNAGTAAKSDVITEDVQLLSARASLIDVGVARAQNEHAIAVLTGRPPSHLSIPHSALSRQIRSVPAGVPSTLLERRPDIAAAEETMRQANALIGVAVAGYYPDLTLTAEGGYLGNPALGRLGGSNPAWTIAASLAQPLFDAGLTDAEVAAQRATYDADVATYRGTVLTAFQQVEDALASVRILSKEAGVRTQTVREARQAVDIAMNEYRAGTQNFTTVVIAQATALTSEQSELTTWAALQTATVNLIVALGGGWRDADLPDVVKDASATAK
jgi:NodT family efflux transporter outer membrane factor (OMF) lipoprotein